MTRAFWRTSVKDEVDAEVAFHLEMTMRELMASGMSQQQARAEAERRFGNTRAVTDECQRYGTERDRKVRRAEYLDEMRQDAAFALRQLGRARGFAAVAILTLALGIGATAAVFSTLDAVVLRPLPFDHAERIVELNPIERDESKGPLAPEYLALASSGVFDHVAAAVLSMGITMKLGDVPEIVTGGHVSADYFSVFGARPELGRTFSRDEDVVGGAKVVVISHRMWKERFNGDAAVLGRAILLDGAPHAIIGVMPASFDFMRGTEYMWVPLALTAEQATNFSERFLRVFARLRPGQSVAQAEAAASAVEHTVAQRMPSRNTPVSDFNIRATNFQEQLVGGYAGLLLILLAAVGFVLLIACTNVANLLLARGAARARELAIRAALGAGRGRLVRQLFVESLVLGVSGALAGLVVAYGLLRLILRVAPPDLPRLDQAAIDWRVLVFTLLVGLASCVIFGLLPAIRAVGPRVHGALRDGGRFSAGLSRDRVRGALVSVEVALAITLLIGSGLLLRSAWLIQRVNPGFDSRGVLAARLMLPAVRYASPEQVTRAYAQIRDEAARMPGVASAALTSVAPLTGMIMNSSVLIAGQAHDTRAPSANVRIVSPGYLETMGIALRAGRQLGATDTQSSPLVVVVNEALARRLWPSAPPRDAIGKRIDALGTRNGETHYMEVVGVAADARDEQLSEAAKPEFYVPVDQTPAMIWPLIQRSLVVVVRSTAPGADAGALERPLSRVIASFDPSLPIADAQTMERAMETSRMTARMTTVLLSLLGGIALALAMVGIYGVVAYFVGQRTQEIGVRMALGATHSRIWRFVARQGLVPVATGLVLGIALSMATTGALTGQLYGVTGRDPVTLASVAGLLGIVALAATYVPARRAMRVSPAVALVSA